MGTRVDFYVGRGTEAEWLGSYAFDGYPMGVFGEAYDNGELFTDQPLDEQGWRNWVTSWLALDENVARATTPDMGWPWPWEDSRSTDYAYAWESADGLIYGSCFGHKWFRVDPLQDNWGEDEDDAADKSAIFPNMSSRKAVTYGPRSGLIVISGGL